MRSPSPSVWLLAHPPDLAPVDAPGWRVRPLDADDRSRREARTLVVGVVDSPASTADALAAAALGTPIAIHVRLHGAERHRFLEDLARLSVVPQEGPPGPRPLGPDEVALLDLLATGSTVTAAAQALHLSRRTTNRMLQEARQLLGVDSNPEAISAWAARSR